MRTVANWELQPQRKGMTPNQLQEMIANQECGPKDSPVFSSKENKLGEGTHLPAVPKTTIWNEKENVRTSVSIYFYLIFSKCIFLYVL